MDINDYEFMEKVKDAYDNSLDKSIRAISKQFGLSRTKVRKILITMGVIESDITNKALSLKESGMDIYDIAKKLGVSIATVSTYLPYDTVIYKGEIRTPGAIRNEKYRKRNRMVLNTQVHNNEPNRKESIKQMKSKETKVLKLRMQLDLGSADIGPLKKYGNVKEGIIREVLVPNDISLHALHYVIQKAFGWRNSHLHHFLLPKNVFNDLTSDSFIKWADYCGIYFRYPSDDYQDIYWDDDYSENVSVNTWFKKKYTGPYHYYGISENFMEARTNIGLFIKENKTIRVPIPFKEWAHMNEEERKVPRIKDIYSATCEEMNIYFMESGGIYELLERLKVSEILGTKASEDSLEDLVEEADIRYDENDIFAKNEREYHKKMNILNSNVLPLTKQLIYEYDYGDGWKVNISLENEYCINEENIDDELKKQIEKVIENYRPLCIMADGLPVLDDVGGIGGYCEMLSGIHEEGSKHYDYNDPIETKEWARMQGWTGRMNKPEHIL